MKKVPADGSKKMDDTLMESVEPYDFKEAVPFRMAYMAGYLADRYDVPKEECIGRAKKRIRRSTEREFRNTVKGYHVIDQEKSKYGDQRPGKVCSLSGMDLKYDLER